PDKLTPVSKSIHTLRGRTINIRQTCIVVIPWKVDQLRVVPCVRSTNNQGIMHFLRDSYPVEYPVVKWSPTRVAPGLPQWFVRSIQRDDGAGVMMYIHSANH